MLSFKQYLNESRVKVTSVDHFISWASKNCAKNLKNRNFLFRGFNPDEEGLAIGNSVGEKPRKSLGNIPNNYTLWIDGHPKFEGFPKRSRSFITTTQQTKALDFGHSYVMLCKDDAKVAAVLAPDIWVRHVYNNDIELLTLNAMTEAMLAREGNSDNKNYFQFQNALQHLKLKSMKQMVAVTGTSWHWREEVQKVIAAMEERNWKDMYDVWNSWVSPDLFEIGTGATVDKLSTGEMWVEGEAAFIPLYEPSVHPKEQEKILEWLGDLNPTLAHLIEKSWNKTRPKSEPEPETHVIEF